MIRTYSELIKIPSFEERYEYLRIGGAVGEDTFGYDRWINQDFYTSHEWRKFRRQIIARDLGCDLASKDRPFLNGELITIHHMNPISQNDLINVSDWILNPEFLVCVSKRTHDAIHFGDASLLPKLPTERTPYDTCPWKLN